MSRQQRPLSPTLRGDARIHQENTGTGGGGYKRPPLRAVRGKAGCVLRNRPGFTLVEILVSVGFLALAFLALTAVFAASRVSVKKAYYMVRASMDAEYIMEIYRGMGNGLSDGTSAPPVSELPAGSQLTVVVSSYPSVPDSSGLKLVTGTLTWPGNNEAGYVGGSVEFQTLMADRMPEGDYKSKRGY